MKVITILIVLANTILACFFSASSVLAGDEYSREVVFETAPFEPPYKLRITMAPLYSIEFTLEGDGRYENYEIFTGSRREILAPSIGYFWAFNDDKLAFINDITGRIYLLDLATQSFSIFKPEVDKYNMLQFIWVGPEDDIYVQLRTDNWMDEFDGRKVFRFVRDENDYIYDDHSRFPSNVNDTYMIRISPLNNIYVLSKYRADLKASVYNKTGKQLGISQGSGENLKGREYRLSFTNFPDHSTVEVQNLSTGEKMLTEEAKSSLIDINYKYTFDNSLIIYCQHDVKLNIGGDSTLSVNYPSIFGKDFDTDYHFLIDTAELGRDNYRYFTISDVSINYNGDIYAFAIYFNLPGRIFGDELIVLYKWSKSADTR